MVAVCILIVCGKSKHNLKIKYFLLINALTFSFPCLVQVKGSIVKSEPYSACGAIENAEALRGHIALALRGDCMFAAKARRLQEAGAIGVIFIGKVLRHNKYGVCNVDHTTLSLSVFFLIIY